MKLGIIGGSGLCSIDHFTLKKEKFVETPFGDGAVAVFCRERWTVRRSCSSPGTDGNIPLRPMN